MHDGKFNFLGFSLEWWHCIIVHYELILTYHFTCPGGNQNTNNTNVLDDITINSRWDNV